MCVHYSVQYFNSFIVPWSLSCSLTVALEFTAGSLIHNLASAQNRLFCQTFIWQDDWCRNIQSSTANIPARFRKWLTEWNIAPWCNFWVCSGTFWGRFSELSRTVLHNSVQEKLDKSYHNNTFLALESQPHLGQKGRRMRRRGLPGRRARRWSSQSSSFDQRVGMIWVNEELWFSCKMAALIT